MLNEELKMQYFDETNEKRVYIYSIVGEYEDEIGKDIMEMNGSEFLHALEMLQRASLDSIKKDVTSFRKYFKWCVDRGYKLDASLMMVGYQNVRIENYIGNILMPDISEIYSIDNYYPVKDGYYDVVVLILSWYGVSIENSVSIMERDIMFSADGTCGINIDGRFLRIDKKSSKYIKDYMSVESVIRSNSRGEYIAYPQRNGKLIYPVYKTKDGLTKRGVCAAIRLHGEDCGIRFDINNVGLSGRMFRYYQIDLTGKLDENEMKKFGRVGERYDLESEIAFYNAYKKVFYEG